MTIPTLAYSILLVIYLLIMFLTPDRDPGPEDREIEGEDRFIQFAIALNVLWLFSLSVPYFTPPLELLHPHYSVVVGVFLFFLGVAVRSHAIRTLGHYFTYKLTIRKDHELIQDGIYRYLRHPSYTGTLLEVIGMMVVARSWAGLLVFGLSGGVIIARRIAREERMLREEFGEAYEAHAKRTKRLIPFIF